MAKTFDQIIVELTSYVTSLLGSQDTRPGTVLREGFLAPLSRQLESAYARTDEVESNQSIASPESLSAGAMERIASNFGIARFPGSPASGTVRFMRYQAPASAILIPSGTVLSSSSYSSGVTFSTVGAVSLSGASPIDPISGAYYVEVPVKANASGVSGNVDADTIRLHSVPGIDEVTNVNALSGGKDEQTNTELAELIIARAQGNIGTRGGYESMVRSNFAVDDIEIITPTDPEASRAQFGGEVDITILTSNYIGSEETTSSSTVTFYPAFLPLIGITEIIGIEDGTDNEITLVPSTDYDVIIDTYSPLSRCYIEKSRVSFHVSSFVVKSGSLFTIRYQNSEIIRVIQSYLSDPNNSVLGSDVLVKLAIEIPVNLSADIRIIPGYDPDTVKSDAESAVQSSLNTNLLGDDVQLSDLITVIGSVDGVDSVDLSTIEMARADNPLVFLQEVLANKQEYIRAGTIAVTVVG